MNEFYSEENHSKPLVLLFHSHGAEEKFKERTNGAYDHVVIKDKEEKRISSMLDSAGEIGKRFLSLQMSAISVVALAQSTEEAALVQLGLAELIPCGMAICPTCLYKAIAQLEENLIILKDIQEATKEYAAKFI